MSGYWLTLHASMARIARRKLRSHASEIRSANGCGSLIPSLPATYERTEQTSAWVGAATRTLTHRERIGAITLHGLVQQNKSLWRDSNEKKKDSSGDCESRSEEALHVCRVEV